MHATSQTATVARRKSAQPPKYELPFCRPGVMALALGVSVTTFKRLRAMRGFPQKTAVGTYDRRAVIEFVASLTREQLRSARREEDAQRARRRIREADTPSAELRSAEANSGTSTPADTPE